jgi:hypothetical protein
MRTKLIIVFAALAIGLTGCSQKDDSTTDTMNASLVPDQSQITPVSTTDSAVGMPDQNAAASAGSDQSAANDTIPPLDQSAPVVPTSDLNGTATNQTSQDSSNQFPAPPSNVSNDMAGSSSPLNSSEPGLQQQPTASTAPSDAQGQAQKMVYKTVVSADGSVDDTDQSSDTTDIDTSGDDSSNSNMSDDGLAPVDAD